MSKVFTGESRRCTMRQEWQGPRPDSGLEKLKLEEALAAERAKEPLPRPESHALSGPANPAPPPPPKQARTRKKDQGLVAAQAMPKPCKILWYPAQHSFDWLAHHPSSAKSFAFPAQSSLSHPLRLHPAVMDQSPVWEPSKPPSSRHKPNLHLLM
jgi:hypothetical protein